MVIGKSLKYAPKSAFSWARLRDQVARMTRREDAEDLLHDAWVKVASAQVPARNADALLARVATYRGIDLYRRECRSGETVVWDADVDEVADTHPLQDEILIARERLERLRGGVNSLSPRTRQIFLMYRLDGRKYREIAEELGISQSAVEKHISRAMTHLADWMENW
ncbi:RNA polymerase sigma factor [Novosphingobium sp.]|jgi:RNA polymerase sigma-70 factor (ECF subfamily)|uniref:RNA polymerase sigma factor n=1 Tax=Novosphingobium sp. TaxID=1874826 RepID=UPI002FE3E69A